MLYPMSTASSPALRVSGRSAAERILERVQTSGRGHLATADGGYDSVPSKRQVAAMLVALADLTLDQHLLGPDIRDLGAHRNEGRDDLFKQAEGIGRFFFAVADQLRDEAAAEERARGHR